MRCKEYTNSERTVDSELAARCSQGDTEALAELYTKYNNYLYGQAINLGAIKEDAADAVSEVFVKFFVRMQNTNIPVKNVRSYLAESVYNKITDYHRNPYSGEVPIDNKQQPEAVSPDFSRLSDIAVVIEDAARSNLSPYEIEVFRLRRVIGYSTRQTAKILHKKQGTIKTTLNRATSKLHKSYSIMD